MYQNMHNNVINRNFIDYIIKSYLPDLFTDALYRNMDMTLFVEALTHVSAKDRYNLQHDKTYERLEYLGDAIFHMIITEYFYERYDDETEGFLTKLRIRVERGDSMAELTKILGLDEFILVNGIILNEKILEDTFESFIGAFYLNFRMKYTKVFVVKLIEKYKDLAALIHYDDNYKDLLLRYFHQMKWGHPVYGDAMTDNQFVSLVKTPFGKIIGSGVAKSKRKSEQLASRNALMNLGVIVNDEVDPDWLNKIDLVEKLDNKKTDKKHTSIYNATNKLITKQNITKILLNYNIKIPKQQVVNIKMYREAMTHRSYLKRKNMTDKVADKNVVKLQKKSNERLRFLGDAVIHFIIGEFLYHKYQHQNEGFLTRLRCKLENSDALFYLAKQTDVSSYVLVSQNIENLHGRNNVNIVSGGLEAFVGATYLDLGLTITREFILSVIREELDMDDIAESETNYKDLILKLYNNNSWGYPEYRVIKEEGPDHSKMFTMGIYHEGKLMGRGKASSKKKAEQIASKKMYNKIVKENVQ